MALRTISFPFEPLHLQMGAIVAMGQEALIFKGWAEADHLLPRRWPPDKGWCDWEWEDEQTEWRRRAGEVIACIAPKEKALAWLEDELLPRLKAA